MSLYLFVFLYECCIQAFLIYFFNLDTPFLLFSYPKYSLYSSATKLLFSIFFYKLFLIFLVGWSLFKLHCLIFILEVDYFRLLSFSCFLVLMFLIELFSKAKALLFLLFLWEATEQLSLAYFLRLANFRGVSSEYLSYYISHFYFIYEYMPSD